MTISIIGCGRLGACLGAVMARSGFKVLMSDKNFLKKELFKGRALFYEPELQALFKKHADRLLWTQYVDKLLSSKFLFFCLSLPYKKNGETDLTELLEWVKLVSQSCAQTPVSRKSSSQDLAPSLNPSKTLSTREKILVIKSTVPLGTNQKIRALLNSQASSSQISVISCPEFLREGHAIQDISHPERLVIGSRDPWDEVSEKKPASQQDKKDSQQFSKPNKRASQKLTKPDQIPMALERPPTNKPGPEGDQKAKAHLPAGKKLEQLYRQFSKPKQVIHTDPETAELAKLACNSFLGTKISFINEWAGFCEKAQGNIQDLKNILESDSRIGKGYLNPGLGYGGTCLPKDIQMSIYQSQKAMAPFKPSLGQSFFQKLFLAKHRPFFAKGAIKGVFKGNKTNGLQTLNNVVTAKRLLSGGPVPKNPRMDLLNSVQKQNLKMPEIFFNNIAQHYGPLKNKNRELCFWGLSFKKGTDTLKNSPALALIVRLLKAGVKAHIYDPLFVGDSALKIFADLKNSDDENLKGFIHYINKARVFLYPSAKKALEPTKALLVGTDKKGVINYATNLLEQKEDLTIEAHKTDSFRRDLQKKEGLIIGVDNPEFLKIPLKEIKAQLSQPFLVDGRGLYSKEELKKHGFYFYQRGSGLSNPN